MDDDFGFGILLGISGGFVLGIIFVACFVFGTAINDTDAVTLANEVCQMKFGTNAERWENQVLTCKSYKEPVVPTEPVVNPYVIDLGED